VKLITRHRHHLEWSFAAPLMPEDGLPRIEVRASPDRPGDRFAWSTIRNLVGVEGSTRPGHGGGWWQWTRFLSPTQGLAGCQPADLLWCYVRNPPEAGDCGDPRCRADPTDRIESGEAVESCAARRRASGLYIALARLEAAQPSLDRPSACMHRRGQRGRRIQCLEPEVVKAVGRFT